MTTKEHQITDVLLNEKQYIEELVAIPDSVLVKKLDIVRQQIQMAWNNKLTDALELFSIWERQIIAARYLKNDFDGVKQKQIKEPKEKQPKIKPNDTVSENTTEDRLADTSEIIEEQPKENQLALFN
jgi:hypothetical protein